MNTQPKVSVDSNFNLQFLLNEDNKWAVIDSYFKSRGLVKHQIDTFNWFLNKGLKAVINNEPSITCDKRTLKFNNIMVERPIIVDDDRTIRKLYPQEARNKDLSYLGNVCVDIIETVENDEGKPPQINEHYRVPIAKIPIMLMSDACNLRDHSAAENETVNGHSCADQGGYFIINGKERILISQVRKVYNKPMCFFQKDEPVCEMRSMCDETFHSTSVLVKEIKGKMVVSLKLKGTLIDMPVGVVFKALGFGENAFKDLLKLGDAPWASKYVENVKRNISDEFTYPPNVQNDATVDKDADSDEEDNSALMRVFRAERSTSKGASNADVTIEDVKKSLDMDLFPHLGITSSTLQRASLLGYMVKKFVYTKEKAIPADSRDDYNNKRVETAGELCYFLFRLLYKKFQKTCVGLNKSRIPDISNFLRTSGITTGILYSFSSGYWGVQRNTYIRTGVSQVVNPKVSLIANYSSLRRVVIPESKDGKEAKTSELRQIHPSTSFLLCPVETPEGKGVGTVLNLSVFAGITTNIPTCEILDLINTLDCVSETLPTDERSSATSSRPDAKRYLPIFVNGVPWKYGHVSKIKKLNFMNDSNISIVVDMALHTINIFTDSGRLIRPMFDLRKIQTWNGHIEPTFDFCLENQLIRFIDINELYQSTVLISPEDLDASVFDLQPAAPCVMEMDACGMFGIVAGIIPFSDRTQSARNCFYTSMVKQAIGYIPCHNLKTETVSHTLNYPQKPLVTTRLAEMNDINDYPNGINCIVAIMCYTGYNQEDSVILNKSSIDRGLFGTMTYNTFSAVEKKNGIVDEKIEMPPDSHKIRDCNYGLLGPTGVVRAGQRVTKGDILIGRISAKIKNEVEKLVDTSISVQSGEEGIVDRVVDTVVDGCRLVKIVVAQLRIPEIGDKFCSKMAQKGICGMTFRQEDMPFTADGMTPDIIINPNCIPSRMTINQIIATVMGKLYCIDPQKRFKDGTPFRPGTSEVLSELCEELQLRGFSSTGADTMYSGFSGKRIKSQIFIGPTYYHRLKHMVQDKMHARSHGQVTTLYRQPNCGRSQGGGLRFGEMEKDCILVHGATQLLNERMFLLSDPFQIDVCRNCGMMASTSNKCHVCKSFDVKKCNIPYSFKNLLQELNAMGIKTKLEIA
jgi:DNA-directed RNA polymerase II subunit RPB2